MKKVKTLLIFGAGAFAGYKIGVKSGGFQMMVIWAQAHPEDPDAQTILENIQGIKESKEQFLATVKASWERAGVNKAFEKLVNGVETEVHPRHHLYPSGEECVDLDCKKIHVEDMPHKEELIATHDFLATKFAHYLDFRKRWMDIGPGAAEEWGTSQEIFDNVIENMLTEGPGYVAYDLKYRRKNTTTETSIKVMTTSEYSEDAIRQIIEFEAPVTGESEKTDGEN